METSTSRIFKSLSDTTRREIFEILCKNGEMTVGAIKGGRTISQPAISKHLALLKNAGLVIDRIAGRNTFYRAIPHALAPLNDWTTEMAAYWERRFDNLETLLDQMD